VEKQALTRQQALAELRRHKSAFEREFGVTRLGIFGSVARGDARADSDVDVVVELREPDLFALVHIKETLSSDLRRSVDIVSYRERMNEFLKSRIREEAVYV
jgi:uncharacterized protein